MGGGWCAVIATSNIAHWQVAP